MKDIENPNSMQIETNTGKITPCLWFNDNAEEAIAFYREIFPDSQILGLQRYGEGAPFPKGTLWAATFVLAGQAFMAINGGPLFSFTPAISLFVRCETQGEIDVLWNKLTAAGGEPGRCGWLKDRYGLSWQIVPSGLPRLLGDPDPARAGRAMQAMLGMHKLDIASLQAAADGRS